ncbi:MAG: SprB repeat-containing protein, partial [Bacteroidota bacterium]|nr:SprB repeat-containing protein [Bacteroidota bacterium]
MSRIYFKLIYIIVLVFGIFVQKGYGEVVSIHENLHVSVDDEFFTVVSSEHSVKESPSEIQKSRNRNDACNSTAFSIQATITGVITDVSCFDLSDGAIDITVTGGTGGPYGYSWSNSATTEDVSGLSAGQYTVTVNDQGVFSAASFTVDEPTEIIASASSSNYNGSGVSCNYSYDGWINLTVSGGTLPYSYLWSNGETTQDILNLPGDIYDITITDNAGCVKISSANGNVSGIEFTWTFVTTMVSYENVLLPANSIKIDGSDIVSGDYVGAFFEQSPGVFMCGGYLEWTGAINSLTIWPDDNLTPIKDGFLDNDSIYWRIWRASDSTVFHAAPYYNCMLNCSGLFLNNGMAAIDTLIAYYDANALPSINLAAPDSIKISSNISDYSGYGVSSQGASDGYIGLTTNGGTSPYFYNWSTG